MHPSPEVDTSETTPFIGRVADLGRLTTLFAEGRRLVTVLGPAGMGKTRLARRFLGHHAEGLGTGAFVDLTEVTSAEGIESAVGACLGIHVPRGAELAPLLAARGPLLLVCDNFEQLVSFGPRTVGRWLAGAPALRLLVTSRERLALGAEVVHVIEPLGLPDEALALLLQQSRALRPDFAPDASTLAILAELVRRVDGIPLAIELAASRLSVLSPAALLARLEDRFSVLRGTRRDVTGRQATLRGAIEWSWRLMAPEEQRALSRSTVFRGDFDAEAAEAVGLSLELLQALVDKSFVRALPGGRLGLFESIRDFAGTYLTDADRSEAEAQHTEHYLALGEQAAVGVNGPAGLDCRERLCAEQTQLVAVMERALNAAVPRPDVALRVLSALHPVLTTRGPFEAHTRWLDRALAAAAGSPWRARGLFLRGQVHRLRGQLAESAADLTEAHARALAQADRALAAESIAELGIARHELGELAAAGRAHAEALETFRALGDRRGEGRALGSRAILDHEQGRIDRAQVGYEHALRCLAAAGDMRSEAIFLSNLGDLHLEQGRPGEAREHYRRAHAALTALGDRRTAGVVLGNLGGVEHEEGRLAEAAELRGRAVEALASVGDRRMEAVFRGYLACARHEAGALDEARASYRGAIDTLLALNDRHFAALFLAHRSAAEAAAGASATATRLWAEAAALVDALDDAALRTTLDLHQGQLDHLAGRSAAARARLDAASPRTDDERFAVRLLRRTLGAAVVPVGAADAPVLHVDAARRRFTTPGGAAVDFGRRETLWRVFEGLVAHGEARPGQPVTVEAMLAAGWPGERVLPAAGANRVYVAIATLRSMGLRDLLLSRDSGYFLDPACVIRRV